MKKFKLTLLTGEEEARLVQAALVCGDDEMLSSIFATLSHVRRSRLLRHYRAIYSKKLPRQLEETLAGDFLYVCYSIISEPTLFFVKEISAVLNEFPGPDEGLLWAFFCERTEEELISTKELYVRRFKKSIQSDIDLFLHPDAAKWMKLLLERNEIETCCDLKQVLMDAQRLLNLGMGLSYGIDGPVIASLIKNRCYSHLRLVFSEIRKYGKHPWERIEPAISLENRQHLTSLLQVIDQPERFNARALWACRSERGKFWKNLLFVRLSRSKEFYKKMELHFHELYHIRVQDQLELDTGGNILLLLKKLIKF